MKIDVIATPRKQGSTSIQKELDFRFRRNDAHQLILRRAFGSSIFLPKPSPRRLLPVMPANQVCDWPTYP